MDCITDGLLKAMDSLTENHRWGRSERFGPEYVLGPDDWRVIELKQFRKRIEIAESISDYRIKKQIKNELKKFEFDDPVKEGLFLYQMGMNGQNISELLGMSRSWFLNHCSKYLPRTGHRPKVEPAVILFNIKQHAKKVGIDGGKKVGRKNEVANV